MLDTENTNVELEEVQPTAESDAGADNVSEISAPDTPSEKSEGFSSLFSQARQKTTEVKTDDSDNADAVNQEEELTDESLETEADEKVPADETKEDETEKDASKTDDTQEKTSRRGANYKEVVAENERLLLDIETANQKVEKLNTQFKQFGGVEIVSEAMDVFDKLATGKAAEVINELPAHARAQVQQQIFETALAQPQNRVFGVNQVLKTEFGLETDLSQPLMEKVFEFITFKLNEDATDLEAMLDRELEFANTPERELARLKKENELLKSPEKADSEKAKDSANESDFEMQQRVETTYAQFEDTTFSEIAKAELQSFGLQPSKNDTPQVKEAKEFLANAVKHYVGVEMRTAKAFEPLLPFWVQNDTDNSWYRQAEGAYKRAMKTRVQTALKTISKLFNAKPASTSPNEPKIPAPDGNSKIIPTKPKTDQTGGGFSSAWGAAKRVTGKG